MTDDKRIWTLEEEFWLKGIKTFESHLAKDCLMAFPMPTGLLLKTEVLEGLKQAPRWDSILMDKRQAVFLNPHLVVIGYEARAHRGEVGYDAICSSTYLQVEDDWRLFQHQQTPFNEPKDE